MSRLQPLDFLGLVFVWTWSWPWMYVEHLDYRLFTVRASYTMTIQFLAPYGQVLDSV